MPRGVSRAVVSEVVSEVAGGVLREIAWDAEDDDGPGVRNDDGGRDKASRILGSGMPDVVGMVGGEAAWTENEGIGVRETTASKRSRSP